MLHHDFKAGTPVPAPSVPFVAPVEPVTVEHAVSASDLSHDSETVGPEPAQVAPTPDRFTDPTAPLDHDHGHELRTTGPQTWPWPLLVAVSSRFSPGRH